MEMTFPHAALRQETENRRTDHDSLLAAVIARQANSWTVLALRQAERKSILADNHIDRRIHFYAHMDAEKMPVPGAFWENSEWASISESAVYQAGSTNIKDHDLNHVGTGEQSNLEGHGVLRTL